MRFDYIDTAIDHRGIHRWGHRWAEIRPDMMSLIGTGGMIEKKTEAVEEKEIGKAQV